MTYRQFIIGLLAMLVSGAVFAQAPAQQPSAASPAQPLAQSSGQPTFPSAADAGQSLFQAVKDNDVHAITRILGGPTELASSQDDSQDQADRQLFVEKYEQMHRVSRGAGASMTLYIGAENWPFPVPLVQTSGGAWRFDPQAGAKEVLYRRIGANEYSTISACHRFVAGKKQPGAPGQGADAGTAALLGAKAGDSQPVLLDGYNFKVLAAPSGGLALMAYPAEYRSTGVMTFVVTGNDVVYEKDLGPNTSAVASSMQTFTKDPTWHDAENGNGR